MIPYDPDLLEEFAERLYNQADRLVLKYVVAKAGTGFFLGAVTGVAIGLAKNFIDHSKLVPADVVDNSGVPFGVWGAFLGALLGATVGLAAAKEKAFELRFRAQRALCQLQIEKNSRKPEAPTKWQDYLPTPSSK